MKKISLLGILPFKENAIFNCGGYDVWMPTRMNCSVGCNFKNKAVED